MIVLITPENINSQGTWIVRWRQYSVSANINFKVVEQVKVRDFLNKIDSNMSISFIFSRCYSKETNEKIKYIQFLGHKVYLDLNDNHLTSRKYCEHDLMSLQQQIRMADGIICSSEAIQSLVNLEFPSQKTFVLNDFRLPFCRSVIPELKSTLEIVFFGFAGNERHMTGVFDLIKFKAMFNELNDLFPVRLNIVSNQIGTNTFLTLLKNSNFRIRYIPYTESNEVATLRKSHCTFLPGVTTPYTSYKTENRPMLAYLIGRPIYSPVPEAFNKYGFTFDDPKKLIGFLKMMGNNYLDEDSALVQNEYIRSAEKNLIGLIDWLENNE